MTTVIQEVPVEDRLKIQEVGARYAFRCDTEKYDSIAELFTDDGVWDETVLGLPRCEGRTMITDVFRQTGAAIEGLIHINSNHQITAFDGNTASATTHLLAEGRYNGNAIRIFGYYADDYAKVDGEWKFSHRKLFEILPSVGF